MAKQTEPRTDAGKAGTVADSEGTFVQTPTMAEGSEPQAADMPDQRDNPEPAISGFTPEGERLGPQALEVGEGGEPGFAERAEVNQRMADAHNAEAAEWAAFRAWQRSERTGKPAEEMTNADARAFDVSMNIETPPPEQHTLLAAHPDAFAVTREQGVAIHVPVEPPKLTRRQQEAGDIQPSGVFTRPVVVPYGARLPEGTTAEQLQYLLLLGWARPAESV